jgi:hypothetical protein
VDTVGGVDLQFWRAVFHSHLVNGCRAEILAGIAVFAHAPVAADISIEHVQVARLIFFVPGAGMIDVGEPVKRQVAVGTLAFIPKLVTTAKLTGFIVNRRS